MNHFGNGVVVMVVVVGGGGGGSLADRWALAAYLFLFIQWKTSFKRSQVGTPAPFPRPPPRFLPPCL